jgi:hypothetical protein
MGEKRNVYRLLVGKPEGKRPLRRPRRRWIDNIKMDLLEIGLSVVDGVAKLLRHCLQARRSPVADQRRQIIFSFYLILPAALGPEVY